MRLPNSADGAGVFPHHLAESRPHAQSFAGGVAALRADFRRGDGADAAGAAPFGYAADLIHRRSADVCGRHRAAVVWAGGRPGGRRPSRRRCIALPELVPYATDRLASWRDPFADPLGEGHQTIQSLYAIASGGLAGLGLGNSRQKYLYVPEPQNDFIFSILCEELGFIGAALAVALFLAAAACGACRSPSARGINSAHCWPSGSSCRSRLAGHS